MPDLDQRQLKTVRVEDQVNAGREDFVQGPAASQPMPKSRILVIDDEAAIRDSLRMTLEYEGTSSSAPPPVRKGSRWPSAKRPTSSCSTSRCRAWTASRCWSGCAR